MIPAGVSASAKISLETLGHFCTSLCPVSEERGWDLCISGVPE